MLLTLLKLFTHVTLLVFQFFIIQRVWLAWCKKNNRSTTLESIGVISILHVFLLNTWFVFEGTARVIPGCIGYLVALGNLTALRAAVQVFKLSDVTERMFNGLILIGYAIGVFVYVGIL